MKTKLKCLLLDDELPGLMYLKMLCEQLPELEVVKAFDNPEKLLSDLPHLDFDLCILDIEMPQINGLQVANLLNGKPVIFTTAYKEYASEAFDINAIDYVKKPIKKERMQQAVQKAMQRFQPKEIIQKKEFVQWNTDKGKAVIFFDQLRYIKVSDMDSRDKTVQMADGISLTLKNISFEKIMKILPEQAFLRINKSEVIARSAVRLFSFDEITTNITDPTGEFLTLSLSEVYRERFIEALKN